MKTSHEVTCVTLNGVSDRQEQITHIGGIDPRGRTWRLTLSEAIQGIIDGRWELFVNLDGRRCSLRVSSSRKGFRYLTCDGDGEDPETLLNLRECGN